ncbi:MAG TPA: L-threonylcarbamoyladenylate synthase [Kofleriaceae bacterium]|nr:L-threonylcarbamoyladenylate synthase [Kofleriaceae bacterium]
MKIVPVADAAARADEVANVLAQGGLACFPMRGSYRLAADVQSEDAVNRLMQSKRRAKHHPSLVLVASLAVAGGVVGGTGWRPTRRLADRLWPGPLTMVLPPSDKLPARVSKVLTRATGRLGVQVPDDPLARAILDRFGGPLLLSSANLEQKPGASSGNVVQQRFGRTVDIWIDAGEMKPGLPSTIVELTETAWTIIRDGAVSRAALERATT